MKYLINAQNYALAKGDDDWFCEIYANYREYLSVSESVFNTLAYLYNQEIAESLKV